MDRDKLAKWLAYFELEPMAADRADARDTEQRAFLFNQNRGEGDGLTFEMVKDAFRPDWCNPPAEDDEDLTEMADGCDREEFKAAKNILAGFANLQT